MEYTDIPQDCIVEPKPSIAGPTLQGIAFSIEEKELKEMFLNLLGSSMDKRASGSVHPSYVEIIKQLTCEEARWLKDLFSSEVQAYEVAQLWHIESDNSHSVLQPYMLDVVDEAGVPECCPEIVSMIDNFIRLGLITVDFSCYVSDSTYKWVRSRPEIELVRNINNGKELNI